MNEQEQAIRNELTKTLTRLHASLDVLADMAMDGRDQAIDQLVAFSGGGSAGELVVGLSDMFQEAHRAQDLSSRVLVLSMVCYEIEVARTSRGTVRP